MKRQRHRSNRRERQTELNVSDFNGVMLRTTQSLAVLFTAKWCPFCLTFNPIFKSALREKQLPYGVVDLTDFGNPLWERFEIRVVPTVMVFKDGRVAYRRDGNLGRGLPKSVMPDLIRELDVPHN